jgi:hypothetical protein
MQVPTASLTPGVLHKVCPNVKKMNITAIPCGYAVEGLGFYFIPIAENPKEKVEEKISSGTCFRRFFYC